MKKETYKSYFEKAATEPVLSKYSSHSEQERKLNNRLVGMNKAHERILERKPTFADVAKATKEVESKYREKEQGRYEGNTGDHNTGRNEATIYEHKRNR